MKFVINNLKIDSFYICIYLHQVWYMQVFDIKVINYLLSKLNWNLENYITLH